MYRSRTRVLYSICLQLLSIYVIRSIRECIIDKSDISLVDADFIKAETRDDESTCSRLVEDSLEEQTYLRDSLLGKGLIAPVIEVPRKPVEVRVCRRLRHLTVNSGEGWRHTTGHRWWMYSAYLDERTNSLFPECFGVIQIIVSVFHRLPEETTKKPPYCIFFYDNKTPTIVEAVTRVVWQRAWDPRFAFYNTALVTCPVMDSMVPKSVAVMDVPCPREEAIEAVVISRSVPSPASLAQKNLKIGVCVKGLDFLEDKSEELIEWIEFQKMMGAGVVVIYVLGVPERMEKVLEYYNGTGNVIVKKFYLPGPYLPTTSLAIHNYLSQNRQQKRRLELVPYNDCFTSLAAAYDYVLLADIDEFVVPLKHRSWTDFLASVTSKPLLPPTSISIRNVFKFSTFSNNSTDQNDNLLILRQKHRVKTIQDKNVSEKSFINTKTIATVFNHFALHRLMGNVSRILHVDPSVAIKLHYRPTCPFDILPDECKKLQENPVVDDSLDPFAGNLRARVRKVRKAIFG